MYYGLYLSASGVMANAYRQDVIANNLANSETTGFKRDLAMFQERKTALRERNNAGDFSDPLLEKIGGGLLVAPSLVDSQQGDLENTDNPLDVGIQGAGYFTVSDGKAKSLTRDGAFMLSNTGDLVLSSSPSQHVLDEKGEPIHIAGGGKIEVLNNGGVLQDGKPVARINLVDVADPSKFTKRGATLLSYPAEADLRPAAGEMHGGFQEHANVDPARELAELMDTQRQLEANANMIKSQDSMLDKLVNDVAKIS